MDNKSKKNTATFKKENYENLTNENQLNIFNRELKEPMQDISFDKPLEDSSKNTSNRKENEENIIINSTLKVQNEEKIIKAITVSNNYRESTNSKDKLFLKNNLKFEKEEEESKNCEIDSKEEIDERSENKENKKNTNNQNNRKDNTSNFTQNEKVPGPKTKSNIKEGVDNIAQKELFGSINVKKEKDSKTNKEVKEINISTLEKADNINHNFELSKEMEKENSNPNMNNSNKIDLNNKSKSEVFYTSKKSGFSNENKVEAERLNIKSAFANEDYEEFSDEKIFKKKKLNNELKSSFEAELVIQDPEYIKEMKELYKLFKKNLLKIKFEKFPNNENCNKKHLNLNFPEREIFNTLIKQNIPEEEWYDFIYEEILNYNCLKTLKTEDNQTYQVKNVQKKSKLED